MLRTNRFKCTICLIVSILFYLTLGAFQSTPSLVLTSESYEAELRIYRFSCVGCTGRASGR